MVDQGSTPFGKGALREDAKRVRFLNDGLRGNRSLSDHINTCLPHFVVTPHCTTVSLSKAAHSWVIIMGVIIAESCIAGPPIKSYMYAGQTPCISLKKTIENTLG